MNMFTVFSCCALLAVLATRGSHSAPSVADVDGYITCNLSTTEREIKKEDPSDDACCCQDDDTSCKSYRKSTHVCVDGNIKVLVTKKNRRQEDNRFGVCGSPTFLRNYMFCNSSTGEVVLFKDPEFRSQKLCKNQLPRGPDTGPAIRLHNKEVHIQGRVNLMRVDMSATFLFIDLLPFSITNLTGGLPPSSQLTGQMGLQVKVHLPAAGDCMTLHEVQNYMQGKTLDIWVSTPHARFFKAKKHWILTIPEESSHHWMMISQRAFQ